jgi:hypothetical protein
MGPNSKEAYTLTRTLEDGSHGLKSFSIIVRTTGLKTTYRRMRSCHSTTAWSMRTDSLLVWYSTPSALKTRWKPAGIRRRPRVRSTARIAWEKPSVRAELKLMSHTSDDDLLHSSDVCLSRVLGLFWVAWLLVQGLKGITKWLRHGVCRKTKQ